MYKDAKEKGEVWLVVRSVKTAEFPVLDCYAVFTDHISAGEVAQRLNEDLPGSGWRVLSRVLWSLEL